MGKRTVPLRRPQTDSDTRVVVCAFFSISPSQKLKAKCQSRIPPSSLPSLALRYAGMQPTGILDPRHGQSITKRICSAGELDGGADGGERGGGRDSNVPFFSLMLQLDS